MNLYNEDVIQYILQFLEPKYYVILKLLSKEYFTENILQACLTKLGLTSLKNLNILETKMNSSFLLRIEMNCCNDLIPDNMVYLNNVTKLKFYNPLFFSSVYFDWNKFFTNVNMKKLCDIEFHNIDINNIHYNLNSIIKIFENKLIDYNIIKNIYIPFRLYFENEGEDEYLKIYSYCNNINKLIIDISNIRLYCNIINIEFKSLKILNLIGVDILYINKIIENEDIFKSLEKISIIWIFSNNLSNYIYMNFNKPNLKYLNISHSLSRTLNIKLKIKTNYTNIEIRVSDNINIINNRF